MADARGSTASVRLGATSSDGRDAVFAASGTVITFRGFMAAYEEGRDVDRYADDAAPETAEEGAAAGGKKGAAEARLPQMAQGDALTARDLAADGHRTSPPPR